MSKRKTHKEKYPDRRGFQGPSPGKIDEMRRNGKGVPPEPEILFCPIHGCTNTASNSIWMIRDDKRVVEHRCREHTDRHHALIAGPGPL